MAIVVTFVFFYAIRKNIRCAVADKIISESQDTDEWYGYFDDFAAFHDHPKSLVSNRALHILAANAQWDDENRFDVRLLL